MSWPSGRRWRASHPCGRPRSARSSDSGPSSRQAPATSWSARALAAERRLAQPVQHLAGDPVRHAFSEPLLGASAAAAGELVLRVVRELVREDPEPHAPRLVPQPLVVDEQPAVLCDGDRGRGDFPGPLGRDTPGTHEPSGVRRARGIHEDRERVGQGQLEVAHHDSRDRWEGRLVARAHARRRGSRRGVRRDPERQDERLARAPDRQRRAEDEHGEGESGDPAQRWVEAVAFTVSSVSPPRIDNGAYSGKSSKDGHAPRPCPF